MRPPHRFRDLRAHGLMDFVAATLRVSSFVRRITDMSEVENQRVTQPPFLDGRTLSSTPDVAAGTCVTLLS